MEKEKRQEPKKKFFNYIAKFWLIYMIGVLLVILFFYGVATQFFGPMPSFQELENPKSSLASEVISSDGKILGTYYIQNRSNVSYRQISPDLINALISVEDIRFMKDSGIDERAILRVIWGLVSGHYRGGGSTITQQLAKNLFPRGNLDLPHLIIRKFEEWITAVKLERYYSKQEIITMYLNTVFFGHNAYGIKAAARTFFDKSPDSLNLQESALMAGVVNMPTHYSPILNPKAALERRNLVLHQMLKYHKITKEVYDSVVKLPLGVENYRLQNHNTGEARYFRAFLRDKMSQWCATHFKSDGKPYNLYTDGLKIFTTINSRMEKDAEEAVREHLANYLQPEFYKVWKGIPDAPFDLKGTPAQVQVEVQKIMDQAMKRSERYRKMKEDGYPMDSIVKAFNTPVPMRVFSWKGELDTTMTPMDSIRYYKYFLMAGLMSMETNTGFVRAYVGGIDFKYFKYDHVTQAKRQVGSTFKPFLYTLAMQEGQYSPCYKVPNIQYSVPWDGKYWTPENSGSRRIGQEVSLKWALATSNNWIAAWLIRQFSPQSVIQMARNMGITSPIPAVPSIALGTADISLYEMTGAMNTFADKGVYIKPIFITKIEDKNGDVLYSYKPHKNEAMSEVTAYKMIKLLEGVVESGTGVRLGWRYGYKNPIAGKTGTSQNQSDGWFIGIVPKLTTGVWVGASDRSVHFHTETMGQGANMALPIWAIYMKKIYADTTLNIMKSDDFQKPMKNMGVEFDCKKYDKTHRKAVDESVGDHF